MLILPPYMQPCDEAEGGTTWTTVITWRTEPDWWCRRCCGLGAVFRGTLRYVPSTEEHHHARSLLSQARRALERASQAVSERAQLLVETWFHSGLEREDAFWASGVRRWGGGSGYVVDVLDKNRLWFSNNGELNEDLGQ